MTSFACHVCIQRDIPRGYWLVTCHACTRGKVARERVFQGRQGLVCIVQALVARAPLVSQGARSALQVALTKEPLLRTRLQCWIVQLHARVGYHKTLVAIANKHARMIWAILAKGEDYDPDAWRRWTRPAAATPPAISGVTT